MPLRALPGAVAGEGAAVTKEHQKKVSVSMDPTTLKMFVIFRVFIVSSPLRAGINRRVCLRMNFPLSSRIGPHIGLESCTDVRKFIGDKAMYKQGVQPR